MAIVSYDGARQRPTRGGRGRQTGYVPETPGGEGTPGGMPNTEGNPNSGFPGPTPTPTPEPAPNPFNFGNTYGLDPKKFGDPNKRGFKYDTMRAMSAFDPRQGFTADVLKALNALGYGTFSSRGGDRLSLTGATGSHEAADFTDQDWIYAHDAQNDATKWSFGGGGWQGPSPETAAYGPDPTPDPYGTIPQAGPIDPRVYGGGGFFPPGSFPTQPQGPEIPPIFSDPAFWQQLVAAMQPQNAPGYSNAPTPNFGGAQYGTSRPPVQQPNTQIQALLSQLFAGMAGGK
jgi:hypothetical protein